MSRSTKSRIVLSKDLLAGALFMLIGVGVVIGALSYPIGSVFRMGPGAFPILVGGLTTLVGVALVAGGLLRGDAALPFLALRPLALMTAAIVVFAVGLDHLGLVISTVLLVVISRLASPPVHWRGTLVLAGMLTVIAVVIFHYFLRLPLELWP